MSRVAVIDVLRRFLPAFLATNPTLHGAQRRAIWAIGRCRTPAMGGHLYTCDGCDRAEFRHHSCNHRSCPQCGRSATARWVERELGRRVDAPYFMVTFTLPAQLRGLFASDHAAGAIDCLFASSSGALREKLAAPRWLGAEHGGFTGVLHTWNQRLGLHPHVHYIVPGCGLDADGSYVQVRSGGFLVPLPVLRGRFRELFRERVEAGGWDVDPAVWDMDWGVDIRPFGDGANAIKYLGAYVSRAVIGDGRIVSIQGEEVTYRWKDRANGGVIRTETIPGVEFVRRYLLHVLPRGVRSVRHYGFCHPAAKARRQRVAFHSGAPLVVGGVPEAQVEGPVDVPTCPCCDMPMVRRAQVLPPWSARPPPLDRTLIVRSR